MNIGEAAKASGVTAKSIRHYESIGLIRESHRSDAGYRFFSEADINMLKFIRRARSLGFSLDKIRALVSLWQNHDRASADVKALALSHVAELEHKLLEISEMRDSLKQLAECCRGDDRPDCPIIVGLADADPLS